ncbi:MAG TPA: hypothetical protein P5230_02030 [Candidatus Magasanikbacteria bacterium]|nr:hypothetical protein [Candidatus Magasanikbacteria bacterium]
MLREGIWGWVKPKARETKEVEKTGKFSRKGDGVNLEEHPFADEKAELHPYENTDKPVRKDENFKNVENIESHYVGTGNPEDEMIAKEEADSIDPYAKYNALGDTRPPQRDVTWDDYKEDEEYFRKIEEIGEKGNNRKEDVVSKPGTKGENEIKTPTQIKKETKIKKIEEKWWFDGGKPKTDRGQQPKRKNKPTGIKTLLEK